MALDFVIPRAQDAADADRIGRMNDALRGIPEESAAKTASLPGAVDCETSRNDDRNRIGHIASKAAGDCIGCDCTRCQSVITDDSIVFTDHISARCTTELIGSGSPPARTCPS